MDLTHNPTYLSLLLNNFVVSGSFSKNLKCEKITFQHKICCFSNKDEMTNCVLFKYTDIFGRKIKSRDMRMLFEYYFTETETDFHQILENWSLRILNSHITIKTRVFIVMGYKFFSPQKISMWRKVPLSKHHLCALFKS